MEAKNTFDLFVNDYDRLRPQYPIALYEDIIAYSGIKAGAKLLEIGAGTGIATAYFLKNNFQVDAIEPGINLSAFMLQKFCDHKNLKLITKDFESSTLNNDHYDLVYSATAFHWVNPIIGYTKIKHILKPSQSLALFWNHPFVGDENDIVHQAIQKQYQKYFDNKKAPRKFLESDLQQQVTLLSDNDFVNVETKLYHAKRQLNADDYVALLNTYSDHVLMLNKHEFQEKVKNIIKANNNTITVYDTVDLYLAKKRPV